MFTSAKGLTQSDKKRQVMMMNTAEQVKATFVKANVNNGKETFDMNEIIEHCESLTDNVDQDFGDELTQFNFADGSCLVVSFDNVSAYGAQA